MGNNNQKMVPILKCSENLQLKGALLSSVACEPKCLALGMVGVLLRIGSEMKCNTSHHWLLVMILGQ